MLLRELLDFQILAEAGLRIVAGGDDLDRRVRWIHTGEIADIARYLSGGEVLLTAATGLGSASRDRRRRYIRELFEAGAVGVIVELGRAFRRLPPEMVSEAERLGILLAELEHEVPFVMVTQQVHTAILIEHHRAQERATSVGDHLTRMVLEGQPLPALLECLAERLHNPVVLEDGSRHAVSFAAHRAPVIPLLRNWHAHSRQGHHDVDVGVHLSESSPRCVWSSIALRDEIWGRLHVLEVDTPLEDATSLALGRAASNIALYLLAERDVYLAETAERSLVGEVARGSSFSGEEFLARATGLGLDFDDELVMLVVGPVGATEEQMQTNGAEQFVREALRSAKWPSLVGAAAGRVVVVASAESPRRLERNLATLVGSMSGGKRAYHVGVSRRARASMLHRAFSEAQTAQQLGPTTGNGPVHHYDNLVLHRLLSPLLHAGPELSNFVESELGELVTYDEEHHSELLRTLDAYLQSNGSKAATAEMLYLQRRSVYYRLTRIEQLLGRSIDVADHRVRLYLALRARELLEARALSAV